MNNTIVPALKELTMILELLKISNYMFCLHLSFPTLICLKYSS